LLEEGEAAAQQGRANHQSGEAMAAAAPPHPAIPPGIVPAIRCIEGESDLPAEMESTPGGSPLRDMAKSR
jgi:hypothetical protein